MYDVNPLGPLMHLKELERQAVSRPHHRPGEGSIFRSILRWLPTRRRNTPQPAEVPVARLRLEMGTPRQ
jgi:hypothetical protein